MKPEPITTDRPAPRLPGLYSIQALSRNAATPSITQYHRSAEAAEEWKDAMADSRRFDAYALASHRSDWRLYNRKGKLIHPHACIIGKSGIYRDVCRGIQVDLARYDESAKRLLGQAVQRITYAEHHQLASSVGHSNMVVVGRKMIMRASDDDLRHIYFVDSVASGCRVAGWFMDASKVSKNLMDKYLDLYEWLAEGKPLAEDHHREVLAFRMSLLRRLEVAQMLIKASQSARLGEYDHLVMMRVQNARFEVLNHFTGDMLKGLESAVRIKSVQSIEEFDDRVIADHAPRIAKLYKKTFLQDPQGEKVQLHNPIPFP